MEARIPGRIGSKQGGSKIRTPEKQSNDPDLEKGH